jgi:hypothetical protein
MQWQCKGELKKMEELIIPIENVGNVSDGYHTFNELYDHRCHLFIALMLSNPKISWRANNHEDGTMFPGWFIAGMDLPTGGIVPPAGQISYHLPLWLWDMLDNCGIVTTKKAPGRDGHTPKDVVWRLAQWFKVIKLKKRKVGDGEDH